MPTPEPTVDELIGVLKRSNLPTVVIEGRDDVVAFRTLEKRLADKGVSFLGAGGRTRLLEIFRRRSEYAPRRALFVADLDLWVFPPGVPPNYHSPELFFTEGYSIENDLYRDGTLRNLLAGSEVTQFETERKHVCHWYAATVNSVMTGAPLRLDLHPNQLLDSAGNLLASIAASLPTCPSNFEQTVDAGYARLLRGKTLLNVLLRQLSRTGRRPRHNSLQLLEIAALQHGALMQRIEAFVRSAP